MTKNNIGRKSFILSYNSKATVNPQGKSGQELEAETWGQELKLSLWWQQAYQLTLRGLLRAFLRTSYTAVARKTVSQALPNHSLIRKILHALSHRPA